MNIVVFDCETTSLEKPFCYNVGYVIADAENQKILLKRDFIVEQVWHNLPLFASAYYAEKRELYVSAMKGRRATLDKFGYICQRMKRDFIAHNVEIAFAYNSPFDEKVFNYNCDWYKCINPFDTIPIIDIRGFAHHFIVNDRYKEYCEKYNLFTEAGNYSTTAESVYKFISENSEFIEEHTALADSEIEAEILFYCLNSGADIRGNYAAKKSIEREAKKEISVYNKKEKVELLRVVCRKARFNKDKNTLFIE